MTPPDSEGIFMRFALVLSAGGLLALAACASPEQRIATKLIDYGMSHDQAHCLADRLESRLSRRQLKTLTMVARDMERDGGLRRLTVSELIDRARRIDDPELLAILARAGVGCAVLTRF